MRKGYGPPLRDYADALVGVLAFIISFLFCLVMADVFTGV